MFNIASGKIQRDVLYLVYGSQSVTYNGSIYTTGQIFRGVTTATTYTFSGSGTQLVYEVLNIIGSRITLEENALDTPNFSDKTKLNSFNIGYQQDANDIVFNDITSLKGFAIELLDYPFYSFTITETRL